VRKFYTAVLFEAADFARTTKFTLSQALAIPDLPWPVDPDNVHRHEQAYRRGDRLPPIRVRLLTEPGPPLAEAKFRLVYGRHRYQAALAAGMKAIDAEIVTCSDAEELEDRERENLNRRELNADQRAHAVAALIGLRLDADGVSVPPGPKSPDPGRPEGGLSKAARDEHISETAAKRAMRIAAIVPEAKALYRADLPDIARIDLEAIAAEPAARQVPMTQQIIADRRAGRPHTPIVRLAEPAPTTAAETFTGGDPAGT
jgi:ParB-like chromosome segregation protein Spo0J